MIITIRIELDTVFDSNVKILSPIKNMDMPQRIKRILLAEDDADDIFLFQEAIKSLCLDVAMDCALDGKEFLQRLEKDPRPDILILDLNLPVISGFDCLCTIRANENYDDLPVLIYTTHTNYYQRAKCLENGADYFVIKSNRFSDVLNLVNAVCRGSLSERFTPWE